MNNYNKYSKLKSNISIFKTILEHRDSNGFPEHLSVNLIRAVTVSMWDNSCYLKESRILSYIYIYPILIHPPYLRAFPESQATHLKGIGTPAATANNDCTVPPPKICFLPNETGPDPTVRSSQFSSLKLTTYNHMISDCRSFGQPIKLLQTNNASPIERVLGWQNEWSPHQSQGSVPSTSSDTRD